MGAALKRWRSSTDLFNDLADSVEPFAKRQAAYDSTQAGTQGAWWGGLRNLPQLTPRKVRGRF